MDPTVIREIQHYLRTLSFYDNRLYPIAVDGFYGAQTADAVKAFQYIGNLPVTGEVDSETWDRLFESYTDTIGNPVLAVDVFPHPVHVISPNDRGDVVPFLQTMLGDLSRFYDNIHAVPLSGVYDEETVSEIRNLQALHALDVNGVVDAKTWNTLAVLFNNRYHATDGM